MLSCKVKLNPDKSKFIVFGLKCQHETLKTYFLVNILENRLHPNDSVNNFDAGLMHI